MVCRDCGRSWSRRDARFCGHCGARLDVVAAEAGAAPRKEAWSRRQLLGVAVAVTFVVIGGLLVVGRGATWLEPADPEPTTDVELPDPEEIPDGAEGPAASDDLDEAVEGDHDPSIGGASEGLGCEPEGCELWRWEEATGPWLVADTTLLHVDVAERPGGSSLGQGPRDDDQPRAVALVTGISIRTGQVRWQLELDARADAQAPSPRQRLIPIDDDLALLHLEGELFGVAPESGHLRWATGVDHRIDAGARGRGGEVVVWGSVTEGDAASLGGSPEAEGDDAAPDDPPGSQPIRVTALDGGSGEPRWSATGSSVLGFGRDHLLLTDVPGAQVSSIAVPSGQVRWSREVGDATPSGPSAVIEDRVVLLDGADLRVVDAGSGEVLTNRALSVDPEGSVRVLGDLALVRGLPEAQVSGTPPLAIELVHLADEGRSPGRIDGVLSTVLLRDSDAAGTWETELMPVSGLALLIEEGDALRVEVRGPAGSTRWSALVQVGDTGCCWRLQPGRDASEVLLVPPDPTVLPTYVIATEDGGWRGTIEPPPSIDAASLVVRGGLAVSLSGADREATIVAGPGGHVAIFGSHLPIAAVPVPIFQGEQGLIAVDPNLLFEAVRAPSPDDGG